MVSSTTFNDTAVSGAGVYEYQILTVVNSVSGDWSESTSATIIDPPSSLTITKQLNGDTFDLTAVWASSTGASGYNLDKSVNGEAFTSVGSDLTGLSATETGISTLGSYVYRINATNVDGSSDYTLASINLSYGDIGAVQSGGGDIGAVQGSNPVTGSVSLVGGTSGMAPFPVHWYADIEGGGSTWATGSGEWVEGRWEFQLIDNGTGEVYSPSLSRNAMEVTCPHNGHTASAFDRYGAVGYAAAVIWDAGSYKCRLRYQNRDGDWSSWADSSTITVSADTRTTYYVDGTSGDDGNDGLSAGAAKATLNAALSLVTASERKIVCKDDTTITYSAKVDKSAYDGVYITRSYDGTNRPLIDKTYDLTYSSGDAIVPGDDWVIDGLNLDTVINATRQNTGHLLYLSSGNSNLAACKCGFGDGSVGAYHEGDGMLLYACDRGTGTDASLSYFTYATGSRESILGCEIGEPTLYHNARISGGTHHDFSFSDLLRNPTGGANIRWYGTKWLGVYRTKARNGQLEVGNKDAPATVVENARVDCYTHGVTASTTGDIQISMLSGASNCFFASSVVKKTTTLGAVLSRFNGDGTWIKNSSWSWVRTSGTNYNVGSIMGLDGGSSVRQIAGNVLMHDASSMWALGSLVLTDTVLGATDAVNENVFAGPYASAALFDDGTNSPNTAAGLNALTYCSGNVEAALTVDNDTGAISGGTAHQGIVTDITGVFESLTAGAGYTTEIDRTAGAWDAGAVQRDSLLVEDPTYIDEITLSGNLNGDDMELEWNLVTQDIDGYEVQRRIDGGSWETLTVT